jgi:hypothetical protein
MTRKRTHRVVRWFRKIWWVQPPFQYQVKWWHTLDRVAAYLFAIILAIHALLGQYIELFELFCL